MKCSDNDRYLLSFPTRRSSDLLFFSKRVSASQFSVRRRRNRARVLPEYRRRPSFQVCRSSSRSEEHTSELQSLRHLVCRLLLEKKKKKQIKAGLSPLQERWPQH